MNIKQAERRMLRVADLRPNEGQIDGVPANPRYISESDYKALCNSLREDDLTGILQMKVYDNAGEWVVLDGNMRLRALNDVGIQEVECIVVPQGTPAKKLRKIVALSNSTFGEWDMDMLANEWDADELSDWGIDTPLGAGKLDENGNYQAEDVTEYEQAQILNPEDEYIIITCSPDEFDDMREHFGCGYIRPLEAGKKYADKRERARVVKWRDYVNSNTK